MPVCGNSYALSIIKSLGVMPVPARKKTGFFMIFEGALILIAAAAVFAFPDGMKRGVVSGLSLCGTNVIPSLFLFSVITGFAVESGLTKPMGHLFKYPARLFSLTGEEFAVFLMSLVSGYPVGAHLISRLCSQEKTDRDKAKRMLAFCVNAGPAFIIIVCGEGVFGSAAVGIRLFAAHVSASVIIALFTAKNGDLPADTDGGIDDSPSFSEAFVRSVSGASAAVISVSAYVVLFSGICGMLAASPLPHPAVKFLTAVFEVTSGVTACAVSPVTAAFLLGFGGISVQLQVMSAAGNAAPSFNMIFLSRVCHGILSAGIYAALSAVSPGYDAQKTAVARSHGSPFSALAFLLLAAVMLCLSAGIKEKPPRSFSARRNGTKTGG